MSKTLTYWGQQHRKDGIFNVSIDSYDRERIEAIDRLRKEKPNGDFSQEDKELFDAFVREYILRGILDKSVNIFYDIKSSRYIIHDIVTNKITEIRKSDIGFVLGSFIHPRLYVNFGEIVKVPRVEMVILEYREDLEKYSKKGLIPYYIIIKERKRVSIRR